MPGEHKAASAAAPASGSSLMRTAASLLRTFINTVAFSPVEAQKAIHEPSQAASTRRAKLLKQLPEREHSLHRA